MQKNTEQKSLTKYLITDKGYTQLINQYTTDYHTQIDHVYTNVPQCVQSSMSCSQEPLIIFIL